MPCGQRTESLRNIWKLPSFHNIWGSMEWPVLKCSLIKCYERLEQKGGSVDWAGGHRAPWGQHAPRSCETPGQKRVQGTQFLSASQGFSQAWRGWDLTGARGLAPPAALRTREGIPQGENVSRSLLSLAAVLLLVQGPQGSIMCSVERTWLYRLWSHDMP